MKFPIYPYNKLRGITFFPPYKNSFPNFTNKEKMVPIKDKKQMDRRREGRRWFYEKKEEKKEKEKKGKEK